MYTYKNGVLFTKIIAKNVKHEEDLGMESRSWLNVAFPISKNTVLSWRDAVPEDDDSMESGYIAIELEEYGEVVIKMTFDEFTKFYDSL